MDPLFQSAIQRIIPHRYPFLLVDRVLEFEPGKRIVGIKTFTANEGALEGQFTGDDIVPTTLMIEMVTQVGAILALAGPEMAGKVAVILQAPEARLLRPVRVGELLRVEAEMLRYKRNFGEMQGWAAVDGERVAEGRMRFAVTDAAAVSSVLSGR